MSADKNLDFLLISFTVLQLWCYKSGIMPPNPYFVVLSCGLNSKLKICKQWVLVTTRLGVPCLIFTGESVTAKCTCFPCWIIMDRTMLWLQKRKMTSFYSQLSFSSVSLDCPVRGIFVKILPRTSWPDVAFTCSCPFSIKFLQCFFCLFQPSSLSLSVLCPFFMLCPSPYLAHLPSPSPLTLLPMSCIRIRNFLARPDPDSEYVPDPFETGFILFWRKNLCFLINLYFTIGL